MCHVQCITASSGEVECYLLHDGTSSIPVSSIDYVYTSVPFRRVDVKMFASGGDGDETIITSIDDDVRNANNYNVMHEIYYRNGKN